MIINLLDNLNYTSNYNYSVEKIGGGGGVQNLNILEFVPIINLSEKERGKVN